MKYWPFLQNGDLVDVVAPAMIPSSKSIQGLTRFFKSWGLRVRFAEDMVAPDLLCSNSKEYRLKDLKKALSSKDSKMVWCLRGGYGSVHLIEGLLRMKPQRPKIFMGFSDITNLHLFLNQQWGWSTIHGSHVGRFSAKEGSRQEEKRVKDLLFGEKIRLKFNLKPLNKEAMKNKTIVSSLVGGNLVNIQSSLGTQIQIQSKNKVLFFEEIDERAYKIDRIFQQIRSFDVFKNARGIVLGQFTGGREPSGKKLVPLYLKAWAEEQKIPIFSGVQSGHGSNQHPLPLNTKVKLISGKSSFLEVETGALDS